MGFDLHMVQKPASADEAELPNGGGNPGYYRFNNWGMQMTVGALEWADAIHYGAAPPLPDFPPAGLDVGRAYDVIAALHDPSLELDPPARDDECAAAQAFLDARALATAADSIKDERVGAFKLESNDGWLVTPDECRLLARKLRAATEMIAQQYFTDAGLSADDGRRWIAGFCRFNEIAAEHGGYRVR